MELLQALQNTSGEKAVVILVGRAGFKRTGFIQVLKHQIGGYF